MTESPGDDDFEGEVDDSIEHPSPDERGLLCFDDPDFLEQLERRSADNSPGIPWPEIRDASL
jgi:hypothetical protein